MGNIEVRLYRAPAELKEAATIVLQNHLFVQGWMLARCMHRILQLTKLENSGYRIAILFSADEPVAVAFYDSPAYQVMAFCRPSDRRKGYGSKAIHALGIDLTEIYAEEGISGSDRFWSRNGVATL